MGEKQVCLLFSLRCRCGIPNRQPARLPARLPVCLSVQSAKLPVPSSSILLSSALPRVLRLSPPHRAPRLPPSFPFTSPQ
ncbi:unnamed protein product [Merluccius merluccius]